MAEAPPSILRRMALRWGAPLLLSTLVIGFYWRLVLTDQYTWLDGSDFANQVLPWFQFEASEAHRGHLPLWDPYAWGGQPLLGQAQPGVAYPLNWLLFLTPLKNTWIRQGAMHWYFVLIRVLAALCLYWFCRDLGRSRAAAMLAGAAYGLGGFVGSVQWPQMVNGAVWIPLVFLFQFRAMRSIRPLPNAVLSGFFLGLMWLAGHHQVPLFTTLASGFLWTYWIIANRAGRIRALGAAACSMTIMAAVGAFQTLPMVEYGRLARRWVGAPEALRWNETVPYSVHEQFSLNPLSLLNIILPGFDLHLAIFVGIAGFALAVVGIRYGWRDLRVRWLSGIGLGALLFALGGQSLLHGLIYSLAPMVEKARVPAQATVIFHLALCALIAYGVDQLPGLPDRFFRRMTRALFGFAAILGLGGVFLFVSRAITFQSDTRFMLTAMAAAATGGVLYLWRRPDKVRFAAGATMAILLMELSMVTGSIFGHRDLTDRMRSLRRLSEDADIIEQLRQKEGRFRVDFDGEIYPYSVGEWWGIEALGGSGASIPDILLRNELFSPQTNALLGVRYYVGSKPRDSGEALIFTGISGRKLYTVPGALPRAWSVHQVRQVPPEEMGPARRDPAFHPQEATIVSEPAPPLEHCAGTDVVEIKQHDPDELALDASMACRGMVILSDLYFPGWKATVDGKSKPIYDAFGFLRGLVVERGAHRIEMRYRPRSVLWGGLLSVLGTLIACVAALRLRRNHSPDWTSGSKRA